MREGRGAVLLDNDSFSRYIWFMTIEQTVQIPADHRVLLEFLAPQEIPEGVAEVTVIINPSVAPKKIQANRPPISRYFGILSPNAYGDGVSYQRKIRDEWDD